jgi:diacylglycerol kinase
MNPAGPTPSLTESMRYAIEGLVHVLRTQRNIRLQLAAAVAVLVAAIYEHATRFELIALLLAIAFVLVAEMINTSIEQAIDVATGSLDAVAKLGKDIAAGVPCPDAGAESVERVVRDPERLGLVPERRRSRRSPRSSRAAPSRPGRRAASRGRAGGPGGSCRFARAPCP